jgi:ATP citrate (pro-S)-lyase
MMKDCGNQVGIPIEVFGPETHLTSIVSYALGVKKPTSVADLSSSASSSPVTLKGTVEFKQPKSRRTQSHDYDNIEPKEAYNLFSKDTVSCVYGMQPKAVQNMLDYDHVCGRKRPSVAAMIYPFSGNHYQKFYFGTSEILMPVYQKIQDACSKHKEIEVMVNFASFRSVYDSTVETLNTCPQIRTIAIIAEGVPEAQTKGIIKRAHEKGVTIIGPATVGGIKPGAFRIGNTGGMMDNIIASKLYRSGSVAYVSRSGGMSNELNNIISRNSDGVYEGVAIGGDRYPGTTFIDHIMRYQANPDVKMIVLLGEVGGIDEYIICEALESKKITKPLIAWCMGTCAKIFPYEVQFGHAGALARGKLETSDAKNA